MTTTYDDMRFFSDLAARLRVGARVEGMMFDTVEIKPKGTRHVWTYPKSGGCQPSAFEETLGKVTEATDG